METPILSIKNLSITFGGNAKSAAINQLNLDLFRGQCLGLVGESGSGKSMTALAIMQLLPNAARVSKDSQIIFNGHDLLNCPEREMRSIRGPKIGMIFQDAMSALNPVFTIQQQIAEAIRCHQSLPRHAIKQAIATLLADVGIQDVARTMRSYPHELSGGQRQRAMIAQALACQPDILIADEPTTALDVTIQAQVLELLKDLQEKRQMTLLFISHDLGVIAKLADTIAVMQHGGKVEQAKALDFFKNPQDPYSKQLLNALLSNTPRLTANTESKPLLTSKHLKVYFPIRKGVFKRTVGHVKAVDDITFELYPGQTLALVGESGSGKTTTGKALLNLLPTTSGYIHFQDQSVRHFSRQQKKLFRRDAQIVFQDPYAALNPRIMIGDSIAEGILTQGLARSRQAAFEQVDVLLTQVELDTQCKWRYPHEFSGGQRQRICIARALALKPKLLVLDEPTSALDVSIQKQILDLLESLQQTLDLSYLLITHNLSVVAHMAHQVAIMQRGKIVEYGTAQDVLLQPQHTYTQQLLGSIPVVPLRD